VAAPAGGRFAPGADRSAVLGTLPPESIRWDRAELPAPTIDDFPVVRTLWTIYGPAGSGVGETLSASAVPAWRQELIRLQALTALMQIDPDVASVERPAELVSWYRPWAQRWITARMALRRWLAEAPAAGLAQGVETELTALDAQRQRAAQRIGAANVFDALQEQPQPVDQPGQLWQFAFGGQRPVTACVVEGAAPTVTVRYPYADNPDWLQRFGCCVLLVAGWVVICRTLPAFDAPRRWPQLLGVIVGLAWWLWLSPSVVGLVIVGISLLAGLHPSLRAAPDPSSTIVRISSSYR
jgi:hypothetical protein